MDVGSVIIGVGGLVVAALSLVLTYRERSSIHRQAIYQKQIEAYSAVLGALWKFIRLTQATVRKYRHGDEFKREDMLKVHEEVKADFEDAYNIWQENLLFLPEPVFLKFNQAFSAWAVIPYDHESPEDYDDVLFHFVTECFGALNEAKAALGIEPLSEQILSAVGGTPTKKRKRL